MSHIPLSGRPQEPVSPPKGWAPFALGFRPFFLIAGLSSVVLLSLWLTFWHLEFSAADYYGRIGWHSHEMLFGYTIAVVAGFLLTAVRNWTGIDTITNMPLAALATLWLVARTLPWVSGIPDWLIAIADLAFIPALTLALFQPLWKGRNKVNRVFIPLLASMFLANLLIHLEALQLTNTAELGTDLMLTLVLILLTLVAGRILPFFTQNVIPGFQAKTSLSIERASFSLIILITLMGLVPAADKVQGLLFILFAAVQGLRLRGWYHNQIWQIPILWVLHTGYAWMILGSLLMGLAQFDLFMLSTAKHALTAGLIGVFTLGMMSRVALGHSGRPIESSKVLTTAFVLANIAVALRVFGPEFIPQQYLLWIAASGLFWLIAFLIFSLIYLPILLRPRIDGRPG